MGATWNLGEARLVQYKTGTSAANADSLNVFSPGPGSGKLWIVTGFRYAPSVAETQVVAIEKYNANAGLTFALLNPVSLALNPACATFIEQGMEYTLLPSEIITVRRGNHTAGSTMEATIQFIEVDLPLYVYEEPQIVKREQLARSSILQRLGGITARGGGGGTSGGTGPRPPGGGGGRPPGP